MSVLNVASKVSESLLKVAGSTSSRLKNCSPLGAVSSSSHLQCGGTSGR
ncbi:hypothetical protein [Streptomyces agglomeratus]